jgi:hypothetical protein
VQVQLLPFVAGGPGGVSSRLTELGVIGGLALAGVVKWGLRHGWRHLTAPRGRHRAPMVTSPSDTTTDS